MKLMKEDKVRVLSELATSDRDFLFEVIELSEIRELAEKKLKRLNLEEVDELFSQARDFSEFDTILKAEIESQMEDM